MVVQRTTRAATKTGKAVKRGKTGSTRKPSGSAVKPIKRGKTSATHKTSKATPKLVKSKKVATARKTTKATAKPRATAGKTVKATARSTSRKQATPALSVKQLDIAHFAPLLHQKFHLYPESGTSLEVELIDVDTLAERSAAAPHGVRRHAFSVIFRSQETKNVLPQKIYTVKHRQLGTFDLFLVPIGPDQHGMRYEAVFT